MEPLLVHPAPPAPEIVHVLEDASWIWKPVASPEDAAGGEPPDGWSGAVISMDRDGESALDLCRALRKKDLPLAPLLLICSEDQLRSIDLREDLFDDLCVTPLRPAEFEMRLRHLFWRTGQGTRPELIEHGSLVLNLETYQASVGGHPLDLTYMEYELLKFLASHPAKVFTRETLLSRVWGYEYYGGARTVDVHVRRLRAKLGEQHASLIQTVRSVGYLFGSPKP